MTSKKVTFDEPLDLMLATLPGVEVIEVPFFHEETIDNSNVGFRKLRTELRAAFYKKLKTYKKFITMMLGRKDIRDRWYNSFIKNHLDDITDQHIDIIISTYGPRSCHLIGAEVKKLKRNSKWFADYRDLWSHAHPNSKMDAEMETTTVGRLADAIVTVSSGLANTLQETLKCPVHVIPNGFDISVEELEEIFAKAKTREIDAPIKIVYTGTIYPSTQDPTPLFIAINQLIESKILTSEEIIVHFYGARQPGLKDFIAKNEAESYTCIHGHVPYATALLAQKNCDFNLLLESARPENRGMLTGKLFEYMVSGSPILSIGSPLDSAIGELIQDCKIGFVMENDHDAIKRVLITLKAQGTISYRPDVARIGFYSRQHQAKRLYDLFLEAKKADGFRR
ncbi:hypothetical protein [Pusillimonas sp. ANT_WB101]|uniref:hypothetical protein n=1 Tax=Pusillimonas sp. ANT_WB101 TaxID=2597356 RepID=UPI001CAA845E|nr:hypothetical protein [Pusillimonas sp. ANT_WB101]